MLEHLIPSTIRCKLLQSLLLQPDTETDYPRALAIKLQLSYMPVQRELKHFHTAGIVRVERMGNRHIYTMNRAYPLYRELKNLFKKASNTANAVDLPPRVNAAIAYARSQLPAKSQILLFGSRATGEARSSSDWDIGLLTPEQLPLSAYLRIKAQVRDQAWPDRIDIVDFRRVTPQFRQLAMRHALPLGGSE